MNYRMWTAAFILFSAISAGGAVAAPFQNLDFEQATQSDADFNRISTAAGLPGWTVMYGNSVESNIWYNDTPLDVTSVTLDGQTPLDGSASVQLYGVYTGNAGDSYSASITQTGDIPADAKSIRFILEYESADGGVGSVPYVSINGESIDVFPVAENGNLWLMVGDIAQFAGAPGTLTFAAIGPPGSSIPDNEDIFELDDITFSTAPVPEPASCLLLLAALPLLLKRSRRM